MQYYDNDGLNTTQRLSSSLETDMIANITTSTQQRQQGETALHDRDIPSA